MPSISLLFPAKLPCTGCQLVNICLPIHLNEHDLARVEAIASHPAPVHANAHVARIGDSFRDLCVVRAGSFKAYATDTAGREQVLGFFMPGELIGFDAIETGRYRANLMALQTASLCVIPYAALSALFAEIPHLAGYFLRIMSKKLADNELLSGDYTAEERCAAFLIGMSERFSVLGYSSTGFNLPMSRRDVANYLRLAPETVTRVFARFAKDGLLRVKGREITLLDRGRLDEVASCMGPLGI
jgi:CRP/FNR family transcriptional regulator, anaerobic regulatory protein